MDQVNSWLQSIGIDGANLVGDLLVTLLAFAAARWLSRRMKTRVFGELYKRSFARNDAILIGRLISIGIYAVATIISLVAWGVDSTGILTALGAFSVALGLSLQDVFRNFFSGVLLLMEKPFKVGDHVQVQTVEGEVLGIDIRTTMVRTANGSTVMVPNSIMYSQILTTRSSHGWHRLDLKVTGQKMDVSSLIGIVDAGLKASGVAKDAAAPPIVTSTSFESTELAISLVIPDQEGMDRKIIENIATAANGQEIEVARA